MNKRVFGVMMAFLLCLGAISVPEYPVLAENAVQGETGNAGQAQNRVAVAQMDSIFRLEDENTTVVTRDNLSVTLFTDKEKYKEDETVELTLRVRNENRVSVKNVSLECVLPEGFRLAKDAENMLRAKVLPVGHNVTLGTEFMQGGFPYLGLIMLIGTGVVALIGFIRTLVVLFGKKKKWRLIFPVLLTVLSAAGFLIILVQEYPIGAGSGKIEVVTTVDVDGMDVPLTAIVRYDAVEIDPDRIPVDFVMLFGEEAITNFEKFYDTSVKKGEKLKEPEEPESDVAEFAGWYTGFDYAQEFDFSEEIMEPVSVYAKWDIDTTDSDGDGLYDVYEKKLETEEDDPDTDGDDLNDYIEVCIGTDPLRKDSDDNGISDYEEDADGDLLTNGYEAEIGTDAGDRDTDGDGLEDYAEGAEFGTNPLLADTDGDGRDDFAELSSGYNPLEYNDTFVVVSATEAVNENNPVAAKVELNLPGEQAETLRVERVSAIDTYMVRSSLPGYMGAAYDFTVEGEVTDATLTFTYDTDKYGAIDEHFQPRIYYINEETGHYEELENQWVDNGTVRAVTTHFSKYILLNKAEFDTVWEKAIRPPAEEVEEKSGMDVVLLLDSSLSMPDNDPTDLRKDAAKLFLDKLEEGDRATVIPFSGDVGSYGGLTENRKVLKQQIDNTVLTYGTDLSRPVSAAIDLLAKEDSSRYQYVILLTDGVGDYQQDYSEAAKEKGIVIFTIGLGPNVSIDVLEQIAADTGGAYFHVSSAEGLMDVFTETAEATQDFVTDTNNDGICDYYANLLFTGEMPYGEMFMGVSLEESEDWDGDGLKNGEEIEVRESDGKVYLVMHSNPLMKHSDLDGISDFDEARKGWDPLVYTVDKEAADILFEDSYYYHSHIENQYLEYDSTEWTIQTNAVIYGVWDQDSIYRDVMIDYFTNYPPEEFREAKACEAEREMMSAALQWMLEGFHGAIKDGTADKALNGMDGVTDTLSDGSSYVKQIKDIYSVLDDLNATVNPEDFRKIAKKVEELFQKNARRMSGKKLQISTKELSPKVKKVLKSAGEAAADAKEGLKGAGDAFDKASTGVSILSDAISMTDTLYSFGAISANSEMLEESILILDDIEQNARLTPAREAAREIKMQLAQEYWAVLAELGQQLGTVGLNEVMDWVLDKVVYFKIVTLVRDGMDMAGGISADVTQVFEMFAYAEMARSTKRVLQSNLVEKYDCYEARDSEEETARNIRTYLVHLINIRVLGEKKYYEVVKKDGLLIDWFKNEDTVGAHIKGTFDVLLDLAPRLNIPVY